MSSKEPSVNDKTSAPSTESRDSAAPLLRDSSGAVTGTQTSESTFEETATKPRKRDFWKLGKKPEEDKQHAKGKATAASKSSSSTASPSIGLNPTSPIRSPDSVGGSVSPHRGSMAHPYGMPGSPGYGVSNSSPRPHSPASSMIFERNVQEEIALPETSPHLPTHVLIENHIAPALDASAEAITNEKLDPDTVEIVTHVTHQPAAVTISGLGAEHSLASSVQEDFPPAFTHRQDADTGSNYGSLDSTDVRRLSFISFADVVHGEQELGDTRRDSTHLSGHPSLVPARSPSPIRSPTSSAAFGTSPPTSVTASVKGFETSPNRAPRGAGSPLPGQSSPLAAGSEINVETMTQALRRTGSGDLSHFRSPPLSAVGNDDGTYERPFR
ncbi:uncharacterized protein Z519_11991 [Cladophialophora bantiana CBS 173.52]|uniref:Uncharacterized protein n=1 Tax=Cladophialophora bantiana (strain ATCC 10958 / CBS 173.52 / CDC B-1940 / NIH 8579) TaxID=1442370 RepID=A0A0D2H8Z8_CLAB1|nr:uncharacterized protein Z519_11991 [Cladophialophora bantiana CBS 173.52]KIW87355.1 hypothetical protein Z519_11991 [Cladophialophora bantiana CBS 173.52]